MASRLPDNKPACPFCPFTVASELDEDMYHLFAHLEMTHPENGESPFIVRDEESIASRPPNTTTRSELWGSNSQGRGVREGTSRSRSHESISVAWTEYDSETEFIPCPLRCGEVVHVEELAYHMELHDTEETVSDDARRSSISRDLSPNSASLHSSSSEAMNVQSPPRSNSSLSVPTSQALSAVQPAHTRPQRWKDPSSTNGPKGLIEPPTRKTRSSHKRTKSGTRRLGKSELGPYAYEERMPAWLYKQLERGAKITSGTEISPDGKLLQVQRVANETSGIIPVLAQLCQQDRSISKAFLCHPSAKHIFKMPREGGFCGYRNIQMAISFLQGTGFPGHEHFPGMTPSILQLQDLIEGAWDMGFNATGRVETGGIRGTRKYIGTPEAQALFCSLGIGCEASAYNISAKWNHGRDYVHDAVLEAVLEYFSSGVEDPLQKVYQTGLAPIYFQHPGHSLTIVGLEVRKSGAMNLLVLDPMFKTVPGVVKLIGTSFRAVEPDRLLKAFRRGDSYLGKYSSFETLKLTNPAHSAFQMYDASMTGTPIRGDGVPDTMPSIGHSETSMH